MTDPTIAFCEHLIKTGLNKDADFLQDGIQLLSQMLMELEVEDETGAKKHERTPERKIIGTGIELAPGKHGWERWS